MRLASSGCCDCWMPVKAEGLSAHFIMELLMRPGPTPRAQGGSRRTSDGGRWEAPSGTTSCPGCWRGGLRGVGGRRVNVESGAAAGECCSRVSWETHFCPEAVWKGHCPRGEPTGPRCRVSAGRVVFVQTGSGRLRGACPSKYASDVRSSRSGSLCFPDSCRKAQRDTKSADVWVTGSFSVEQRGTLPKFQVWESFSSVSWRGRARQTMSMLSDVPLDLTSFLYQRWYQGKILETPSRTTCLATVDQWICSLCRY